MPGLPNIGGNFSRKRIRKPGTQARRRIKNRKILPKSPSVVAHKGKGVIGYIKSIARNIIIAGTDKLR